MDTLYDTKEIIILNQKELLTMIKEYALVYMKSFLFNLYNDKIRKKLVESLTDYYRTIQMENSYLEMILDNINTIDEEKSGIFMDKLDALNEKTYNYHERVLSFLEEKVFQENQEETTLPYRNFKTIIEDKSYYSELLDIFVYPDNVKVKKKIEKLRKF